jgi:predicted oxidoreductase
LPPNPSSEEAGVLVVEASLAGLGAAEAATRSGAETLLIDAAPEVGACPNAATLLWSCSGGAPVFPCPKTRGSGSSRGCDWAGHRSWRTVRSGVRVEC